MTLPTFDFAAAQIQDELQQFFVLIWAETFGTGTADTWQVRTMTTRSALAEAHALIETARIHPKASRDLFSILEEVGHLAGEDEVIKSEYPFFKTYFKAIVGLRGDAGREPSDLESLSTRLSVLIAQLSSYEARTIAQLRDLLLMPTPDDAAVAAKRKQKEKLVRLTKTIATEVSTKGYSNPFIRESIQKLLAPAEAPFSSRFDAFIGQFAGGLKDYRCVCAVSWPDEPSLMFDGKIRVTAQLPDFVVVGGEPAAVRFSNSPRFAAIQVKALDAWDAHEDAVHLLARASSALSLYSPRRTFRVQGPKAFVAEGNLTRFVSLDDSHEAYIRDATDASAQSASLLDLQNELLPEVREQLAASLEYHRLAIASTTESARLVNMWIALESLTTRGRGSTIQVICDTVPSAVAIGNIKKHLRSLAIYIMSHLNATNQDPAEIFHDFGEGSRLEPRVLLRTLRDAPEGPHLTALYNACSGNALLRHRVFRLEAKILRTSKMVAENLKHHRQNVEWQLRRIYRTRNEIVHRGGTSIHTRRLLQHLHTFVMEAFLRAIHSLRLHPKWSLVEVFAHRRSVFDFFVEALEAPTCAITQDALVDPDLALRPTGAPSAW